MIRLAALQVPMPPTDALEDEQVLEALAAYTRLFAQASEAQHAADAADRKVKAARESDVEGYARALRAGRKDPGPSGVEKAQAELEKVRRHAEAAGRATSTARDELEALVGERRTELAATAEGQVAEARVGLREAVDILAAAHAGLGEALSAAAWVQGFPDKAKGIAPSQLVGMTAPNREPYNVDAAIVALRELAADPEPAPAAA